MKDARRRLTGASAAETAIVLPIALLSLFVILDLGLASLRYNALAEAARRLARAAVTRGDDTPSEIGGDWGPEEIVATAADSIDPALTIHPLLPTMNPKDVSIRMTWPDTTNNSRSRVRVELKYQHQPLVPGLTPWGPINLESSSQMRIVN
ncbi:TadE family protein [Lacipirellula sp.]|uniref:TadE family protein n=1 Tax=Lacipirellula sp. TaxID=2691419 RepID=UPI003D0AA585